jgi:hypothetical protein
MYLSHYKISILVSLLAASRVVKGADSATVSITSALDFAIEPACVQSCMFYNSFGVADYLLAGLGCTRCVQNVPSPALLGRINHHLVQSTTLVIAPRSRTSAQAPF